MTAPSPLLSAWAHCRTSGTLPNDSAEPFGTRLASLFLSEIKLPLNQSLSNLLEAYRIGKAVASCQCIMFNLIPSNELIELSSRTWWPEKKDARHIKKTANKEESLPLEQKQLSRQETTCPPESVFFVIELA